MAENIYQMYVANGNKAGFWVQRNSWSWQTALITSIGGQTEGKLEGLPPYFKNQKVKGRMGVLGGKSIFPAREATAIVASIRPPSSGQRAVVDSDQQLSCS